MGGYGVAPTAPRGTSSLMAQAALPAANWNVFSRARQVWDAR